jgi:hypothetical protein
MDFQRVTNFGGIAADVDELLRECFQDHPAYVAARNGAKFLVIGRKGSGKTAIYQKLILEKKPDYFSFGHTFDDYPWPHHDLQAQVGVPEERRYVHSWKYLILMTLSKILLNQDQSQPWNEGSQEAMGQLESFVVDSYGSRDPDITQLFSPEKELRFKGSLSAHFVTLGVERLRVRELPVHVQEVNQYMQRNVMASLNPAHEYFVCFDQLDLGFSTTEPQYAQRLTGLLVAARDLQRAATSAAKKLSITVFLRDDIYSLLQFEDKNKITETSLATVEWGTSDGESTLKRLMERRFGQVFRGEDIVPWEDVFDENKQMPSRQTKYAHICDRTFLRPRDMIKFCNEILDAHRLGGDGGERFVNKDVIDARSSYSDYLLNELDDEIAKHVPRYKEYLEVVGSIGRERFSREQFVEAWAKRKPLADIDPSLALQQLFDFSVIGYLKTGGGGGGSQWAWRYRDIRPHRAVVPADAETLRVHPGFKEALDLTKGSSG